MTVRRETSRNIEHFSWGGLDLLFNLHCKKCMSKGLKKRGRRNRMEGVKEIVRNLVEDWLRVREGQLNLQGLRGQLFTLLSLYYLEDFFFKTMIYKNECSTRTDFLPFLLPLKTSNKWRQRAQSITQSKWWMDHTLIHQTRPIKRDSPWQQAVQETVFVENNFMLPRMIHLFNAKLNVS